MDTTQEFIKEFSSFLQPYGYNIKLCMQAMTERVSQIDRMSTKKHPGLLDRIPSIRSAIQNKKEAKLEKKKEQWQKSFQAPYPYIRDSMGKEHHFEDFLKQAEQWKNDLIGQKDGWYHLPETIGGIQIPDEDRKDFEALCQERGMHLPYAVGKAWSSNFLMRIWQEIRSGSTERGCRRRAVSLQISQNMD